MLKKKGCTSWLIKGKYNVNCQCSVGCMSLCLASKSKSQLDCMLLAFVFVDIPHTLPAYPVGTRFEIQG